MAFVYRKSSFPGELWPVLLYKIAAALVAKAIKPREKVFSRYTLRFIDV